MGNFTKYLTDSEEAWYEVLISDGDSMYTFESIEFDVQYEEALTEASQHLIYLNHLLSPNSSKNHLIEMRAGLKYITCAHSTEEYCNDVQGSRVCDLFHDLLYMRENNLPVTFKVGITDADTMGLGSITYDHGKLFVCYSSDHIEVQQWYDFPVLSFWHCDCVKSMRTQVSHFDLDAIYRKRLDCKKNDRQLAK